MESLKERHCFVNLAAKVKIKKSSFSICRRTLFRKSPGNDLDHQEGFATFGGKPLATRSGCAFVSRSCIISGLLKNDVMLIIQEAIL
jgi:hypothetical protein